MKIQLLGYIFIVHTRTYLLDLYFYRRCCTYNNSLILINRLNSVMHACASS